MTRPRQRILVLGATGLLGNAVFSVLHADPKLAVSGTVRGEMCQPEGAAALISCNDVAATGVIEQLLDVYAPSVVINCVGLVKDRVRSPESEFEAFRLNAEFPHRLADVAQKSGARVIHFSTDCVFSGEQGGYAADAAHDARDAYGMSKSRGELPYSHCVTIRSSIVGHCLKQPSGLFDWLLDQKGVVSAYANAWFSGLTTLEMARLIRDVILPSSALCGVHQVAAEPISKASLLALVQERYRLPITFQVRDEPVIDRTLDGALFRASTGYVAPSWPAMIDQLAEFYGTN